MIEIISNEYENFRDQFVGIQIKDNKMIWRVNAFREIVDNWKVKPLTLDIIIPRIFYNSLQSFTS